MKRSLSELFSLLYNDEPYCATGDLFGFDTEAASPQYEQDDVQLIANFYSSGFCPSLLPEPARCFYELSANAFGDFIHAWMSELPIEAQLLKYGRRVIALGEMAAGDRGDADTVTVLNAASKAQFEVHRMLGFLRFSSDENNFYTARCAPDHFVLPGLGEHFTSRFGETGWAIIDEKRGLCLCKTKDSDARIISCPALTPSGEPTEAASEKAADSWEELWRLYHRSINNEGRKNLKLQRQLMPERYHKYLPEMEHKRD